LFFLRFVNTSVLWRMINSPPSKWLDTLSFYIKKFSQIVYPFISVLQLCYWTSLLNWCLHSSFRVTNSSYKISKSAYYVNNKCDVWLILQCTVGFELLHWVFTWVVIANFWAKMGLVFGSFGSTLAFQVLRVA